jgi:hypothetical protein
VLLRFTLDPSCVYSREVTREVPGATTLHEEQRSGLFGTTKTTTRLTHSVTEHYWKLSVRFTLHACTSGVASARCVDMFNESVAQELITRSDSHSSSPVGALTTQ